MENKVALITGATSGIGKISALKFGSAGAKVVVSGSRESEGQVVARIAMPEEIAAVIDR